MSGTVSGAAILSGNTTDRSGADWSVGEMEPEPEPDAADQAASFEVVTVEEPQVDQYISVLHQEEVAEQPQVDQYFDVPDLVPPENTMRYWSLPPTADARPNAIVLLVHGLGCAARDPAAGGFDQPQTRRLCRFGRVLAPDLFGHGGSALPRGEEPYRMRSQAAYLVQLLRHLRAEWVWLVGHSMGGPITVAVAEALTEAVTPKLCGVLYSEPNIDGSDCDGGSRRGLRSSEDLEAQWNDGATVLAKLANAKLAYAACCRDLVRESDSGKLLPRMQTLRGHDGAGVLPSLCLIGSENRGMRTSEAALLACGFPVQYIEGAGHCQHLDNPEEFFAAADALFSAVAAGKSLVEAGVDPVAAVQAETGPSEEARRCRRAS